MRVIFIHFPSSFLSTLISLDFYISFHKSSISTLVVIDKCMGNSYNYLSKGEKIMAEFTNRQFLIIRLLEKNNGSMSATNLSKLLDISTRTLRNDITSINKSDMVNITSSREGYKLSYVSDEANILLDNIHISEQTKSLNTVLQYLLNNSPAHILDISEACYMSESSVVRCIHTLESLLNKYNLKIRRKSDTFEIIGSEYDKRNLFAKLIHSESLHTLTSLKQFEQYFNDFDINDVKDIINEILEKYHLQVDDIHYQNLIVNISISLQRIITGKSIEPLPFTYDIDDDETIVHLSDDLCKRLQEFYEVTFDKNDYEYVQILCIGSIQVDEYEEKVLYSDYSFIYKIKEILDEMIDQYMLDVNYQMSLKQFALHIHRLIFRSQTSLFFDNSFNDNLKNTHPFIYELAAFFSYKLQETFDIKINDGEIGLIAIYLGLMIQNDDSQRQYVRVLCLCPHYRDLRDHFSKEFLLNFNDIAQLIGFVSSIEESYNCQYDLLVSTINDYEKDDCIVVSPLLMKEDLNKLRNKLYYIQEIKKKEELMNRLIHYMDAKLFFRNIDFNTKKDTILFLCNQMLKQGYANTEFVDSVFEREKISDTSYFNKFAIPHAIYFGSSKTCISVLINDKSIPWGHDKKVNIVILISINEKDIQYFNPIYSALVDLLLDDVTFSEMAAIKDYEQFINYLTHKL